MYEQHERILKALNLEKWMTPKQIARLLYPEEFRENWRIPYDRTIKNLQSLRRKDLLKFKDYGLGKDNLWSIKNHSINKELGFIAPRTEIHTYKYEHEKACADVFVALALSEKLISWTAHKKIYKGIIPDRIAELDTTVYIEMEMGSQDKILQKAQNYRRFYFDTKENFEVWFIAKEQKQVDKGLEQLRDFSPHYKVDLLDNLFL